MVVDVIEEVFMCETASHVAWGRAERAWLWQTAEKKNLNFPKKKRTTDRQPDPFCECAVHGTNACHSDTGIEPDVYQSASHTHYKSR